MKTIIKHFFAILTLAATLIIVGCDKGSEVTVASVSVNSSSETLEAGLSLQLTATVLPAEAQNKTVTWTSDNPAVATVSNSGLVTAVAEGNAKITVTTADGGKTATCTIIITKGAPILSANKTTILADGEDAITFSVMSGNEDVSSAAVIFVADTPLESNIFSTTEPGSYKFTAEYDGVTSNEITVTATEPPINVLDKIPDPVFRAFCETAMVEGVDLGTDSEGNPYYSDPWDTNGDGKLSTSEAAAVYYVIFMHDRDYQGDDKIVSLEGIEYFTGMESLGIIGHDLTSVDLSKNTRLTNVNLWNNRLTSLDVSMLPDLQTLTLDVNQLTELDVSNNPKLKRFSCPLNQLTSLDVSKNLKMDYLACFGNQLTSLDVSKNTSLTDLNCRDNQLSGLDISNNRVLTRFACSGNPGDGKVFPVKAWFDNDAIPAGFPQGSSVDYYISRGLVLSVDKSAIWADGKEVARFTVKHGGRDVTDKVQICMPSGMCLLDNTFSTTTAGSYEFYSYYADDPAGQSNRVSVTALSSDSGPVFDASKTPRKNSTFFTFTATWCGPCYWFKSDMVYFNANYKPDVVAVNLYFAGSEPEVDASVIVNPFEQQLGAKGFPTGAVPTTHVDLSAAIVGGEGNPALISYIVDPYNTSMASSARTGISVFSSIEGGRVNASVSVGARSADSYRVGVFLVEDNVVCYQAGGGDRYNHTNVLRQSSSADIFGEDFATLGVGQVASKPYSFDIPATYKASNLSLVVYTLRESGGKWVVDNSVKAPVGSLIPFRYAAQ